MTLRRIFSEKWPVTARMAGQLAHHSVASYDKNTHIFAGIAILSAGWNLKEQRFGVAVICVVSALIFGTAPIWVKNIFDIGGGNGIFS